MLFERKICRKFCPTIRMYNGLRMPKCKNIYHVPDYGGNTWVKMIKTTCPYYLEYIMEQQNG